MNVPELHVRIISGLTDVFYRREENQPFATEWRLRKDRITVGRAPRWDVQILAQGVSNPHLELTWEGPDRLLVRDVGTAGGTFIDGERLGREPVALSRGMRLELGRATVRNPIVLELQWTDAPPAS